MTQKQSRIAWVLVLLTCCTGVFFSHSQAQPEPQVASETLLPGSAVILATWDGNKAHQEAWEQTAAYDALHKTGLIDLLHKFFDFASLQAQAAGGGDEVLAAKQILMHVIDNGFSVAASVAPNAPPQPSAVFVLHDAGKLAGSINAMVKDAVQGELEFQTRDLKGRKVTSALIPDTPGIEIGWWVEGQHLVITGGMNAVAAAIDVAAGDAPNVTSNPLWKKYRTGKDGFTVTSLGWFNVGALRKQFGQMPLPIPPTPAAPDGTTIAGLLKLIGLNDLGGCVIRSGYKGRSMWSEAVLENPGEKTGLMGLLNQKPMTIDDLPPLPFSTNGFAACSVDWSKSYTDVTELAKSVAALGPPDAAAQIDGILAQLPAMIGFDPQKELLDTLGNVACAYGDPRQGGWFGMSFGLAIQVKDAKTLNSTLNKLLQIAAAEAGPAELTIARTQKQGREIVTFQVGGGFVNPSYAVDKDWLIIGMLPQTVEAFLMRLDGNLTAWKPTASYDRAFAELPKQFTSITVSDPRKSYRALVGAAPFLLGFAQGASRQLMGGMELPITVADIPPAEAVSRPLYPNVSVCTVDEDGVRFTSRSSLPMVPLLGANSVATVPILVALLLPAVQQAREAARRASSKNNLKQLMLAMHNYHDVYNKFPQGTVPNDQLKPEQRLSWMVSVLPFVDQNPLYDQIDQKQGWKANDNQDAVSAVIQTFVHPSNPQVTNDMGQGTTHYVGIAGHGPNAASLPLRAPGVGIFGYNRATRIRDITDGTSNTMAISEASEPFDSWAAGGKATIRGFSRKPYVNGPDGIGGPSRGGFNAGLADGSVRFLSQNIDPTILERLAAMADGQPIDEF